MCPKAAAECPPVDDKHPRVPTLELEDSGPGQQRQDRPEGAEAVHQEGLGNGEDRRARVCGLLLPEDKFGKKAAGILRGVLTGAGGPADYGGK